MELNKDLFLSSYDYPLDKSKIALRPLPCRSESKLMVYDQENKKCSHQQFKDIIDLIPENSVLVLNQSKVQKARVLGRKESGGKAEIFILEHTDNIGQGLIKCRGTKKIGDKFVFNNACAEIIEIRNGEFVLKFDKAVYNILDSEGKIPIPPYIRNGESDEKDLIDYQTVFAKEEGSVAAPTAGLHFTKELLDQLKSRGVEIVYITLHVGLGTFLPVKEDDISKHSMHKEKFSISEAALKTLNNAKELGRKITAVGTTSLRSLESMYDFNKDRFEFELGDYQETDIFLHPGVHVGSIDGLITNFHLPKSTLLMLVSSLIGREKCLELYDLALKNNYRFFSYGDSMYIKRYSCIN